MSNSLFRPSRFLAALLATAALVFLAVTPASALDPLTGRPPAPSPAHKWGIPWSELTNWGTLLPDAATDELGYEYGGWVTQSPFLTFRTRSTFPTSPTTPVLATLQEPGIFNGQLSVPVTWFFYPDNRPGAVFPDGSIGNADTSPATQEDAYVLCAGSEWQTMAGTKRPWTGTSGMILDGTTKKGGASAGNGVTAFTCPYIQLIQINVCTQRVNSDNSVTATCEQWRWLADAAYRQNKYDKYNPTALCDTEPAGVAVSPDCLFIIGVDDPTDFDTVCAGAPLFDLLDPTWFSRSVGHFSRCLFNPIAGFNADGQVTDAMAEFPYNDIIADVQNLGAVFTFDETCGQLFPAPQGFLSSLRINTCDWGTFSPVMKTSLTWLIVVMFYTWAVTFVISTLVGLFGRGDKSPVSDEK